MIKLNLEESSDKRINKIVVEGAMDTADNNLITRTVNEEINKGGRFFIVDMNKVTYINSSGMLDLLCCQELLKIHPGAIKFFGIKASIYTVLEVIGVSRSISVLPTEEECIKSLVARMNAEKSA